MSTTAELAEHAARVFAEAASVDGIERRKFITQRGAFRALITPATFA